MTRIRRFAALALAAAVLVPSGPAAAQAETAAPASPEATVASSDSRLDELAALVPSTFAGVPLTDDLRLATGEQMLSVMRPEEAAVLEELLDEHGATVGDYAAAALYVPLTDDQVVVMQAHRIAGLEAALTIEAWLEILGLNLAVPQVEERVLADRPVATMSDAANAAALPLYIFPAADVVWMVWSADEALVQAAMDEFAPQGSEATAE